MNDWHKERMKILMELDVDQAHKLVPEISREAVLIGMHKSRYECTAIPVEMRHQSAAWLRENGYRDMYGMAILPEGQLPT